MSASVAPISAEAFATAIQDLPLSNLHSKAAELQNSISHLLSSNIQLEEFATAGDDDCKEAIEENEVVLAHFEERIKLLRTEVERRGFRWADAEVEGREPGESGQTGGATGGATHGSAQSSAENVPPTARTGGSMSDEELRRRIQERVAMSEANEVIGIHL